MTKRKKGEGLTLAEAMDLANASPPLSAEDLAYLRSPQAGPDADRKYGAPRRGRPKKGETVAPVVGKTVKQTPAFWAALAKTATKRGMTVHEAMREALSEWLKRAG